jgi:hypothetical protein
MPSQATNYFYTLIAMGAVALRLTTACQGHAWGVEVLSEGRALRTVLEQLASECTEMTALTEATGAASRISLQTPTMIGDRYYWLRLSSDSSGAWVEGGFGEPWEGVTNYRVEIPWNVSASGTYRGGYGTLALSCVLGGSGPALTLGRWEAG